MAEKSVRRVSALAGPYTVGRFGAEGEIGVTLCEVPDLVLHQVAAWPESLAAVGTRIAKSADAEKAPDSGKAVVGNQGAVLRVEPLKFWIIGQAAPEFPPDQGASLDLSHSRSYVRLYGREATTLLNRHLPLDLRDTSFPIGSVASTGFHHVGVTLWRSDQGYELFLPRGFALSLWELLLEGAAQFGYEITNAYSQSSSNL